MSSLAFDSNPIVAAFSLSRGTLLTRNRCIQTCWRTRPWLSCAQRPQRSSSTNNETTAVSSSVAAASGTVASRKAAGKARAHQALLHDLPCLLDADRGPLDLVRGGTDELFAPDVAFSFPPWPSGGHGRRMLKMLLSSFAIQARCGTLDPRVEQVVVQSPMPDILVATYVVSCCTFAEELVEDGAADASEIGAAGTKGAAEAESWLGNLNAPLEIYQPVRTNLRVRTRLQFDDNGKIVSWHDTWDRTVRQFVRDLSDFGDVPDVDDLLDGSTELSPTDLGSAQDKISHIESRDTSTRGSTSNDEYPESEEHADLPWDMDVGRLFDGDAYKEDGQLDTARLSSRARALAKALPAPPSLEPKDLRVRMEDIKRFVTEELPTACLPGQEQISYSLFHEHVIFETPFVLAQGADALEMVHRALRFDAFVRFSSISVKCVSMQQPTPELITCTYILIARSRLGPDFRRFIRCQFYVNASGQIVHEVDTLDERTEDFASAFQRLGDHLWI